MIKDKGKNKEPEWDTAFTTFPFEIYLSKAKNWNKEEAETIYIYNKRDMAEVAHKKTFHFEAQQAADKGGNDQQSDQ